MADEDLREQRRTRAWLMLNARASNWEWSPAAHGGLTQAQVAAMLNGLEAHEELAGRLCIAEQWQYVDAVGDLLYRYADHLADVEDWNLPSGTGQVRKLVTLALLEATGGTIDCRECGGVGRIELPGGLDRAVCEPCEGTGRLPRTHRSRAELVGISERQWHGVWKSRYRAVFGELRRWWQAAQDHVDRALRGAPNQRLKSSE